MKKKITMLFLVVASATAFAQDIGMGIGNGVPDASAILDINSGTKGVLIPRVTITDLNAFQLQGDTKTESMLVYNQTANPTAKILKGFHYWDGAKWELITSESRLQELLTKLEEDLNKRIDDITNFGPDSDKSYLVVFKPDGADPRKGVFSYLKPDGAGGYEKTDITLKELVEGSETNTFFNDIAGKGLNDQGDETDIITGYNYFTEDKIKEYLATGTGLDPKDITANYGFTIDVAGISASTFIKNLKTNETYIKDLVGKTPGFLLLEGTTNKDFLFKRTTAAGLPEDISFNIDMETKTDFKFAKVGDTGGINWEKQITAPDAANVKKGEIYYQYTTETDAGDEKNYINLTSDILYSVTNNEKLREEITKIINTVGNGANVYYGKIGGTGDDLLFTIDKDGKEIPIDISKNIINEITTNTDVQNTILEVTKIDIVTDKSEKTNTFIDGKAVYKRKVAATVAPPSTGQSYNIEFNAPIVLDNSASKVISIQILNKDGSIACDAVRDVTLTGMNLTFKFGIGAATTPLATGSYDVIVEFVGN